MSEVIIFTILVVLAGLLYGGLCLGIRMIDRLRTEVRRKAYRKKRGQR